MAESEARLNAAIRITEIGNFSIDPQTTKCTYCSDQHAAHFGLTVPEFMTWTSGEAINLSYVHPDDQVALVKTIDLINSGVPQSCEFRALRPNGEISYIRQIEEPIFNDEVKVVETVGASVDITELRIADAADRGNWYSDRWRRA